MTMSEQTNKPSGFLNVCKKAGIFLLIIAAALVIMGVGDLLGATAYLPAKYSETLKNNAAWKTAEMYLTFWGTWVVMLLALLIPVNRPIYGALGNKVKGNTWKHLGLGILIGFGMNALCIGVAALTGCIHLSYNSFEPVSFLLVFAAVFIQSSAEEVVCRGFIYQHLRHQFASPWVAILCNSVLFSALHLTNPGVTALALINNTLVGILLTMTVYYFDSFWCAAAIHTAWNFTQNILFGLPNSGVEVPYSVFTLDKATAVNGFAYDIGFGIEGTWCSLLVMLVVTAAIVLWGKKHHAEPTDVWAAATK